MRPRVRQAATIVGGIDPWLTLAFLGLICVGVIMVYSSSIASAYAYYDSPYYYVSREIVWVAVGLIVLVTMARIDYRRWERLALPMFLASLVMLVFVLVPHVGHASHGARRWFSLGAGITIEPSELIKLAMVMYMAAWLTSKGPRLRDFQAGFLPFSLMVGLVALLIIKQPDLGTTIVVVSTMFAIYFVAGADLKQLLAVGAGAGAVTWVLINHSSYQYGRLTAFMNPWKDPTGVGYHTVQALMALGSGGVFGTGLGNSAQKYVLPAPHTDSILAVIGEEWGLFGTVTVLILFLIIAYRGMRITIQAPDTFARLLAAGLTSWITFQAIMNFAVITSSVPFTGVPLPLVSYGGTSLVITMAAIGILLNISRHVVKEDRAQSDSYNRGRDGRPRLSRVVDRPVPDRAGAGSQPRSRLERPAL